jgi:fused signal recognition particle receptor
MFDFIRKKVATKDLTVNPEPEGKSLFATLTARMSGKASALTRGLRDLLPGRAIDAELLEELETRLLMADVGITATERILGKLRQRVARKELADLDALLRALHQAILDVLTPIAKPLTIDPAQHPFAILVVGVNGSGKTTSIGKLARLLKAEGRSVMLAAGDTFRAAAVEQLTVWGERNQIPVISQAAGADPAAVIFDALAAARARHIDVLLADTAGRLQNQSHLMEELKKVKRVLARIDPSAPHEVLLVLDASQGQNALVQAQAFHEALGVTGIVLTKLDGTAKGGIIVAIAAELGLPVRYIGIGEAIEDFGEFVADDFVRSLLAPSDPAVVSSLLPE